VAKHCRSERVVLADVGGTNARFAVLDGGVLGPIEHMKVAEYEQFADALGTFMARQTELAAIRRALIGVAGVVDGRRCALTNNSWTVDGDELCERFGLAEVHIVNDFEALAWSLPHLAPNDLRMIGGREPKPQASMVVLGPGTGLGVAAYLPRKLGGVAVSSEAGHATLPSGCLREDAIIGKLREQFGHVSAERALSGPGLQNLYQVISSLESRAVCNRSAAEITHAALAGSCAMSRAAVDTFCALLGMVAGNLALSFCARGGVFIAGGVVPHLRDYLPNSEFRSRFEVRGRMTEYLMAIPVFLILRDDPAFVGLQWLAAHRAHFDAKRHEVDTGPCESGTIGRPP
jgi:glucokinase